MYSRAVGVCLALCLLAILQDDVRVTATTSTPATTTTPTPTSSTPTTKSSTAASGVTTASTSVTTPAVSTNTSTVNGTRDGGSGGYVLSPTYTTVLSTLCAAVYGIYNRL